MTTATINGKKVSLSIEAKARNLQVIDIQEAGVYAVRSANDASIAYAVYHDGYKVTGCACTGCKKYGRSHCAYRQAVTWKLEADRRNAYCETFGIYA